MGFLLLAICGSVQATDLNFPVNPGERKMVTTSRWADEQYDIYLPTTYSATSNPLPLMLTLSPSGGGLVSAFKAVAEEKKVIVVGLLDSKNNRPYPEIYPNNSAVLRDVMERVNYDPSALYTAGFSGGAVAAYDFTKFYRPHVTGVFAMGGWLGNRHAAYDRYRSGLLVARANGDSDTGANYYMNVDASHLNSFGVVISDYSFSGGHQLAPNSTKRIVFDWLLPRSLSLGLVPPTILICRDYLLRPDTRWRWLDLVFLRLMERC